MYEMYITTGKYGVSNDVGKLELAPLEGTNGYYSVQWPMREDLIIIN